MVLKSMTGFGRGEVEKGGRIWAVEIRCVNNRFLDCKIKLPKGYAALEDRIRKKISGTHLRGRVDLNLNVHGDFSDLQKISINTDLAGVYKNALASLAKRLSIPDDTSLSQLVSYPEIIIREQEDENLDTVWEVVEDALEVAVRECDSMRTREGKCLQDDLQNRLLEFVKNVNAIEKLVPVLLEKRETGLRERLEKLLGNVDIDPLRLAQEVAIMADKTDVTEELVRLGSHIRQFEKFINSGGAVGRKLDFLIQEFLREVNTLGSKINDAETAHLTVELKSELEKIREQVQNIE